MKNWFMNIMVKKILHSRKFIYAMMSILVPALANALSVDEETSRNLFIALLSLAGFQGLADFGKEAKKK